MSYFDDKEGSFKTVISSTFKMSKNPMKFDKMCYEFVWESGSGYQRIGVGVSSQIEARYYGSQGFGWHGLTKKSDNEQSFTTNMNEPIMICFDKSDSSNYNFSVIKGNIVRTFIFTCSSATPKSEWRIVLWSQPDSGSDNIELRLDKRKMINKIPNGFLSWLGQGNQNKAISCGSRKSFINKSLLVYVFVSLS